MYTTLIKVKSFCILLLVLICLQPFLALGQFQSAIRVDPALSQKLAKAKKYQSAIGQKKSLAKQGENLVSNSVSQHFSSPLESQYQEFVKENAQVLDQFEHPINFDEFLDFIQLDWKRINPEYYPRLFSYYRSMKVDSSSIKIFKDALGLASFDDSKIYQNLHGFDFEEVQYSPFSELEQFASHAKTFQNRLKEQAPSLELKEKLFGLEADKEQLLTASSSLLDQKLKKKYDEVPSLDKLEEAKHKNDLSDLHWTKRLNYGGNLQLWISTESHLDVSPFLGYRLRENFMVAANALLHFKINQHWPLLHPSPEELFGWGTFVEYGFFRSFVIQANLERSRTPLKNIHDHKVGMEWNTFYLIGLGKRIKLNDRLETICTLHYRLNNHEKNPYASPWQVGVGIRKI